ncbi:MAG: hypothetical protein UHX00_05200 [Caryophanon sp.]|nr:hypothetical protein [Caryophanon sp.]
MADSKEIILDVKVNTAQVAKQLGDATNAVRLLKSTQKELEKALKEGSITSEEYGRAMAANKQSMEQYQREIKSSTALLQAETMSRIDDSASLDEQRQALNAAQKAYALLSGEEKAAADAEGGLRDQINALSESVKKQEAAIGDARRNVGNYAGGIMDAAQKMGGLGAGMVSLEKYAQNLTMGFKTLAATPFLAVVTILVTLVTKLSDRFKGNAAAMETMSASFGAFEGIGNMIAKLIDKIASGIGWLADKIMDFADKQGWLTDEMKEASEIAKEELAIQKEQRDSALKNAEDAQKIAELKSKANDKERYSAKERLAFLKEANAAEEAVAQRQYDLAKREYELQVKKNAQSESSQEDLKKENDLKIAMLNAETALFNKRKELNGQMAAASQEMVSIDRAAAAARLEIQRKLEDSLLSLEKDETQKAIMQTKLAGEREVENLRVKLNNLKETDVKGRELLSQLIQAKEKETQQAIDEIVIRSTEEREQKVRDMQRQRAEMSTKDEVQLAQLRFDAAQEDYNRLAALTKEQQDAIYQSELDYQQAVLDAEQAMYESRDALAVEKYEEEKERTQFEFEEKLAAAQENEQLRFELELEQAVTENEQLLTMDEETKAALFTTQEEYERAVIASEQRVTDAKKKAVDSQRKMALANAQAISGAMGQLSSLLDQFGEQNKEAAIASKAIALGKIAVETGIALASGIAQSQSVPFPANIAAIATTIGTVLGGIASAITTVKGAKFEHGGIVGGTSYTGDHVPVMANSREMYLNLDQQTTLFSALSGGGETLGFNYELMAQANAALPAPVMVYTELRDFEDKVSTYDEIAKI